LAFDTRLIKAARDYCGLNLSSNQFGHNVGGTNPGQRMAAAGYNFTGSWSWGENLAWSGSTGPWPVVPAVDDELYESLFIDGDVGGRGHRLSIMDSGFKEIGVGVGAGSNYNGGSGGTRYNAVFTTMDFAYVSGDSFLTGVVFKDGDGDNFYTPGEGLGSVTVTATPTAGGAPRSVTTWGSGGYTLQLPAGSYSVVATGYFGSAPMGTANISTQNVKLDLKTVAIWRYIQLSQTANASLGGKHTSLPSTAYPNFCYYKGTDSKIWALWYSGGWNQAALTPTANVDDWFTESTTYNQLYYRGTDSKIWALWYGAGKWNQLALTTTANVAGDLQTDTVTNFTYYRGSDNNLWVLWYGAGRWNQAPLTSSARVAGEVAVDSKYHFAYYRGTDSQMWVVWFGAGKWNEARLSTTANVAKNLVVDPNWGTYYQDSANNTWAVWFTGVKWEQTNLGTNIGAVSGLPSLYGHLGVIYTGADGAARYLSNNGVQWSISALGPAGINLSDTLSYKAKDGFIYGRTSDGNLGVFYFQ
jgi:hypothetical protein